MREVPAYFTDVNYSDCSVITREMKQAVEATRYLPEWRGTKIIRAAHCTVISYGLEEFPLIGYRIELLGHLSVLAEMVARTLNDGRTFFQEVGFASVMASAQDLIVHGFTPDSIEDAICVNQYRWGRDNPQRLQDLRCGFQKAAEKLGAAFTGGETGALRYLLNTPPMLKVGDTPVIHTVTHGRAMPKDFVSGEELEPGDVILGARSTGPHINAISAIIRLPQLKAMLREKLSDGQLFGEAVMAEMGCYLDLVEELRFGGVRIHAMLAGSGGGVSKIAFDKRDYTYEIRNWPKPLPVFPKLLEYIKPYDFLKEFNAGIGWYVFVPASYGDQALELSQKTSTPLIRLGEVTAGKRGVMFRPKSGFWRKIAGKNGIWLEPQEN